MAYSKSHTAWHDHPTTDTPITAAKLDNIEEGIEDAHDDVAAVSAALVTDVAALASHLADGSDAHDASAISILDAGSDFTATTVEGALDELQADHEADALALANEIATTDSEISAIQQAHTDHLNDTADAHDASAISNVPAGNIAATTVQAAIDELDTDKAAASHAHAGEDITSGTVADARIASTIARDSEVTSAVGAVTASLDAHITDAADAHDASAISVDSTTLVGTGTDVQAVLEELDNAIAAVTGGGGAALVVKEEGVELDATVDAIDFAGADFDLTESPENEVNVVIAAAIARQTAVDAVTASLQAHLDDTADAHDASAISILDSANDFTATDVEGALAELQSDNEAHLADTTDAHDASAISVDPTGLSIISGDDVQEALGELDAYAIALSGGAGGPPTGAAGGVLGGTYPNPTFAADMATQAELDAHTGDTSDAHDASAISIVDAGGFFVSTEVEAALQEARFSVRGSGSDDAFQSRVTGDTDPRWLINADGGQEFGPGNAGTDVGFYRSGNGVLTNYGQYIAQGGLTTKGVAGTPTDGDISGDEDGTILLDTTNHLLYYRSGGTWRAAATKSALDTDITNLANHLADTDDAHDASAISVLDAAGYYTATNVETALAEARGFGTNAKIIHVATTGSDANDGLTWASAKLTIDGAMTAISAGSGGLVLVGAGSYDKFSLNASPNNRIGVVGIGAVTISVTGTNVGITITGTSSTPLVGPLIENIYINGDGATNTSVGIRFIGGKRCQVRRIRISNCLIGIDHYNDASDFTERNLVEHTLINNCGTGVRFHKTATGHTSFSYNQLRSVATDSCTVGIDLGSSSATATVAAFYGCFFDVVCWAQSNNDICVKVYGDIKGMTMLGNLERIAGSTTIGWDVGNITVSATAAQIWSNFIGTFGTEVQVAASAQFQYTTGNTIVTKFGAGVSSANRPSGPAVRAGAATFPSARLTNRPGTDSGSLELGSGSSAPDIELYREQANVLKTPDQFIASGGIGTKTKAGAVTDSDTDLDTDGMILVDTTNNLIYYRSTGAWFAAAQKTALDDHIADTSDAHDASAISVLDSGGNYAATDVEAALTEIHDLTENAYQNTATSAASSAGLDLTLTKAGAQVNVALISLASGNIGYIQTASIPTAGDGSRLTIISESGCNVQHMVAAATSVSATHRRFYMKEAAKQSYTNRWLYNGTSIEFVYYGGLWYEVSEKYANEWQFHFTMHEVEAATAAAAAAGTRNGHRTLDFDGAANTVEHATFKGWWPRAYDFGGANIRLAWTTTGTTGAVVWNTTLEYIPANTFDIDADGFAAVASATHTTDSVSGEVNITSIDMSSSLDGVQQGGFFRLRVTRLANSGSDTLVVDAQLLGVRVSAQT